MNTLLVAVVLFAATNVMGQNPYEYIDDALLQKVGQIVFEYDQQVAASRAGGSASSIAGSRSINDVSGGYQLGKPERVARVSNFGNDNANTRASYVPQQQQRFTPRQYNQVQQQSYVQPQQYNYQNRNQRQLAAPVVAPVARTYQAPVAQTYQAPVARTYQAPVARTYQAPVSIPQANNNYQVPVAPALRTYQDTQVMQQQQPLKNAGFSAYTLSQPEVVARVAEFHFTDGQESQDNLYSKNKGVTGMQNNGGFRMV